MLRGLDVDAAVLLTTTLVLVVLAGSVFPWLALGVTGTNVDQLFSTRPTSPRTPTTSTRTGSAPTRGSRTRSWSPPPRRSVSCSSWSRRWLSVSALAGTLLAVDACLVVMLRTRQYRTGSEVLVGLSSGILGLGVRRRLAAVAAPRVAADRRRRPGRDRRRAARGDAAARRAVAAARPPRRPGRDACLLGLLPLLVLATGVYSSIRS